MNTQNILNGKNHILLSEDFLFVLYVKCYTKQIKNQNIIPICMSGGMAALNNSIA